MGEGAKWTATITNSGNVSRPDAVTKPECIYKICEGILGSPPSFINFIKWFCYPILHPEISRMTASLEHTLELLPLQNFIDRQLFTNRVQVTLEVHLSIYNARFLFINRTIFVTDVMNLWYGVFDIMFYYFIQTFFRNIFIVSIMLGNIMQLKMKSWFGSTPLRIRLDRSSGFRAGRQVLQPRLREGRLVLQSRLREGRQVLQQYHLCRGNLFHRSSNFCYYLYVYLACIQRTQFLKYLMF